MFRKCLDRGTQPLACKSHLSHGAPHVSENFAMWGAVTALIAPLLTDFWICGEPRDLDPSVPLCARLAAQGWGVMALGLAQDQAWPEMGAQGCGGRVAWMHGAFMPYANPRRDPSSPQE